VTEPLYPLLFRRRLLEKVWGARRLETLLGVELPAGARVGESWELSDHPSGESVVANGPLEGVSLRRLMTEDAAGIVGNAPLATGGRFPLLVKFVDTSDRLSVQVHPDDGGAARLRERDGGKNEAWYVLHADPDAALWAGLAPGVGRRDLEQASTPEDYERCLRRLTPRAGDAIPIPAGTVHAIGPGLTVCEVQQTSDITYRLYDWGRTATTARPLHREQSFAVARLERPAPEPERPRLFDPDHGLATAELPSPGSFRWRVAEARSPIRTRMDGRFHILIALEGNAAVAGGDPERPVTMRRGDVALLPARLESYELAPEGTFRFLAAEPLGKDRGR
jgi:mannose-6-phosphate isomerase